MIRENVQEGVFKDLTVKNDMLKFRHLLCVPQVAEVKDDIMKEAHYTPYIAHPGSTKMYQDL